MLTPFLALHEFTAADVRRVLGLDAPTKSDVAILELYVAKCLIERAGYRTIIRRGVT